MIRPIREWLSRVLVPDAKAIAKRAWSLRLIELAAVADLVSNVVPFMADLLPWWVTVGLLALAWGARLLSQPETKEAERAD